MSGITDWIDHVEKRIGDLDAKVAALEKMFEHHPQPPRTADEATVKQWEQHHKPAPPEAQQEQDDGRKHCPLCGGKLDLCAFSAGEQDFSNIESLESVESDLISAELSRLRDLVRWRDAGKEKPEFGVCVLLALRAEKPRIACLRKGFNGWFDDHGYGIPYVMAVAWLPLPPLPKEAK